MAEQTISAIIQIVALFLPAWAIMVQILARLMEGADLDESPAMIPFFGVGLSLAVVSLWLFGTAVTEAVFSTMIEEIRESGNTLLTDSLLTIMQAELAFAALGIIVLILAGMKYFDKKNGVHVISISILSYIIMAKGSDYNMVAGIAWGLILLVGLDVIYILYRDEIMQKLPWKSTSIPPN